MRRPIAIVGALFLALSLPSLRAQGAVQWTAFGGDGTGGATLTGPYVGAVNAQVRNYPIPVIRDDFSWPKGGHSLYYANSLQLVTKRPDFVTCRNVIVTFRCKPSRLEG